MSRPEYAYCPYCGTLLEKRAKFHQLRPVCPTCGFVQFRDPKVAVIALVIWEDQVLLIRRAVDPSKGKWALPGGYMDAGEMPESALQREMDEEVGIEIRIQCLLDIFPMAGPGIASPGIVLAYHATPANDGPVGLCCGDDVSEAGWFPRQNIPADLAFESTHRLLARWKNGDIS